MDTYIPITRDTFRKISDEEEHPRLDLSSDTTQGQIYRFLLNNADRAFRQREIVAGVDVPEGSVGPSLKRLEERGLLEHRDRYWTVMDTEHAVTSAGLLGAASANAVDGGFSDEDINRWMETAVDPLSAYADTDESTDE